MAAVAARFAQRLPARLGERIRWLFAAFAGIVAVLAMLGVSSAPSPAWPDRAIATALLAGLACWPWVQYRADRLPPVLDLAPMAGILAVGWVLGDPAHVFGLMFVLLYVRALEGSPRRVSANAIGYFAAYELAAVLTQGPTALLRVGTLTLALGVAVSAGVMWLLGDVIRSHERSADHAALLARSGTSIQRSPDQDGVYDAALRAALELFADIPDAAVSLWRGNDRALRVSGSAGDVPNDLPTEVPLDELPDDLRDALLAGEPFALDAEGSSQVQVAVGMAPVLTSILIAPLTHGTSFGGALAVGSRAPLDSELVTTLGRLAADVGLALDRLESEQRFRSLAENVSEGMYRMALHPTPHYEYVNPAMERMTGFPMAAFLDDSELTLRQVHPEDRETILRTREGPDRMSWPVEVRWFHPVEGWRWASLQETVVYGHDGTPLSSMGIISDITARKQQEQALRGALERERQVADELRRLDTLKTTFLQAVSHELRTPLTAIKGYAKTLARNDQRIDDAKRRQLLERLDLNADKLDRLLTDLLDLDRMSHGLVEPRRRTVDVADLCCRVVEQIEQDSHVVRCDVEPVEAQLDAAKVERIVENLVRNAIKHTDPGTEVRVSVRPTATGEEVVIAVADDGRGIPEDLHETIFEPFVQGPGSAMAAHPGTGIGLSLVARFAELHGGRASYQQKEGGGARFTVVLPVAPPASDQPPVVRSSTRGDLADPEAPDPSGEEEESEQGQDRDVGGRVPALTDVDDV